jgi:hypothetical protein
MEPRNRFQGMDSASLCSLAGRYDNPIPPWFLAPIDFLKIQALVPDPCICIINEHVCDHWFQGMTASFVEMVQCTVHTVFLSDFQWRLRSSSHCLIFFTVGCITFNFCLDNEIYPIGSRNKRKNLKNNDRGHF